MRAEADALEDAALKVERLKTADTIPTCPECGGRSFKIGAYTVVHQSINFEEAEDGDGGDWGSDYESGDHTDESESATCNHCGADVQEVLEAFGWTFYDAPQPLLNTPTAPPLTSIESQTYIDGGPAALRELRKDGDQ